MKGRLVLLLTLLAPVAASAAVIRIKVDAPIHPVTSEYVVKAMETADRDRADLVVIHLEGARCGRPCQQRVESVLRDAQG